MDRFFNRGFPIVRIGNRMFKYIKERHLIFGSDSCLSALKFRGENEYFEHEIDENEIDSVYYVLNTYAIYRGYKAQVIKSIQETNQICVIFRNSDGRALGIKPEIDVFDKNNPIYIANLPESEINEIYEVRIPQDGFAFETPRIVFHKRNGKWLPWHELGASLGEDEWI